MKKIEFIKLVVFLSIALIFSGCNKTQAISAPDIAPPAKNVAAKDAISFLEERIKRDPEDFIAHNKLASEYLQKLRETGDITFLNLALRASQASLKILPAEQNKNGLAVLAQAEFSSHDFVAARDHALKLTQLEPNKSYSYQILGDALLELGNYEDAETAFRQMEKLGSLQGLMQTASEQRLARMAFLHGDNRSAAKHFANALRLAQNLPVPPRETIAWCQWQLGETAFSAGDYKTAEKNYQAALETYPDYYRAVASLARVRAAQGDLPGAIEQYEKVVRILPDPNFVAALGDLYKLTGREDDAGKQYELVEQIGHLSTLNGTIYNRSLALFYADHDLKVEDAYTLAAKEYALRQDIYGADALAWTALKAGKIAEAKTAIKDALRLGTKDAKIFYHATLIAGASGDKTASRNYFKKTLALNPQFDPLQTMVAKKAAMIDK